jgi:hypothetical protein
LVCSASLRNCLFYRLSGRILILLSGILKLLLPAVFMAFTGCNSSRYVPIAYRMTTSQTLCVLESTLSYALHLFFFYRVLFIQDSDLLELGVPPFCKFCWKVSPSSSTVLGLHKNIGNLEDDDGIEDDIFFLNLRNHLTIDVALQSKRLGSSITSCEKLKMIIFIHTTLKTLLFFIIVLFSVLFSLACKSDTIFITYEMSTWFSFVNS